MASAPSPSASMPKKTPQETEDAAISRARLATHEALADVDWRMLRSSMRTRTYGAKGKASVSDLAHERRIQDRQLDERNAISRPTMSLDEATNRALVAWGRLHLDDAGEEA